MTRHRIGLGVTGGIAAYKSVELLRLLQKEGCDVSVAMTKHATEFVQPLTFRSLTDRCVIIDDYDPANADPIAHVNFSQSIDLLLIVPATANIIAKFANGMADDFLSSTYLASHAPVMIAPAMNSAMWDHAATQRNIDLLLNDGVHIVRPVHGELACNTVGTGKLEDVENIALQAVALLTAGKKTDDLKGEKVLITVGGTREPIDPVRFISNHSSGKMGFAIAAAAIARGASVLAVTGAISVAAPAGVEVLSAETAKEMYEAVMKELPKATIFIAAAAVSDYAPASIAPTKIKKDGREVLTLELRKTHDILAEVAAKRSNGLLVVGFSAETESPVEFARLKLEKKGADIIVANDITQQGAGFNSDTNIATILSSNCPDLHIPLTSKRALADEILDHVVKFRRGIDA